MKKFKSVKVCPLIHWTWKDIWRYTSRNELDYNPLHDQGYPSIGCAPCTAPALPQRICVQADGMVWRKQNADCMNKELQNGTSRYFI
ncbi:phosphoadenosine phosphosulfate reductase family protein [Bacillus stercoris]|nr:phosphoadenosine phosphosulfate reductase family protein [Bacillus stercoris]